MRIAVLGNTKSPNPGNWALIQGTRNILESYFGQNIDYEYISWDDITFADSVFDEKFFKVVNSCDFLWVIGAVMFNNRPEHTRGGSRFNLNIQELGKISVPIIFGGVSYRNWSEDYKNIEALRESVSYLSQSQNCIFGVRNDGTKYWLEKTLCYESDRILEFPDPGFFALDQFRKEETFAPKTGLLVSMNNEDSTFRFGLKNSKQALLNSISLTSQNFWIKFNEPIGLAAHSFEDYELLVALTETLPKKMLHQNVFVLPLLNGENSKEFYRFYTKAKVVISSRVHSMSPSLGYGNFTIVISSQSRMNNYLQNLGLSDISISISDLISNHESLLNKVNDVMMNPKDWNKRIETVRMRQIEQAKSFLNLVKKLI